MIGCARFASRCQLPLLALVLFSVGCVKAPDIVLVDRKTALEQQASGSFRHLDDRLERAGILPGATPLSSAQVQAAAAVELMPAEEPEELDPAQIDRLLLRRCVGEGQDGLLVATPSTCAGLVDPAVIGRLLERANRGRRQVWGYLAQRRPGSSLATVRRAWRLRHLEGVVCGANVQRDDGTWEPKGC